MRFSFLKLIEGEINKHNSFAILNEFDYQTILDLSKWHNWDIIHRAEANPSIVGFQRPVLGPVRKVDVVFEEHTAHRK